MNKIMTSVLALTALGASAADNEPVGRRAAPPEIIRSADEPPTAAHQRLSLVKLQLVRASSTSCPRASAAPPLRSGLALAQRGTRIRSVRR